jgi:hypothetical protein
LAVEAAAVLAGALVDVSLSVMMVVIILFAERLEEISMVQDDISCVSRVRRVPSMELFDFYRRIAKDVITRR